MPHTSHDFLDEARRAIPEVSVRRMAVLSTLRTPALCRHVHRA